MQDDKNMLYAYGGARATVNGCIGSAEGHGTYKIKVADLYEWEKPDERWKELLSSATNSAYAAAVYLQREHGYPTYRHELEIDITCDGK
jgi:hypothetical protein